MLVLNIPLHWVLLGHFNKIVYNWGHTMLCQTEQFLYIPVVIDLLC